METGDHDTAKSPLFTVTIHPELSRSQKVLEYLQSLRDDSDDGMVGNTTVKSGASTNGLNDASTQLSCGRNRNKRRRLSKNYDGDDDNDDDNNNNASENQRRRKQIASTEDTATATSQHASTCCFEIRNCHNMNGVGMFATRNIRCGDLIVRDQTPIVATVSSASPSASFRRRQQRLATISAPAEDSKEHLHRSLPLFCDRCCAPLHALKFHYEQSGKIDGMSWSKFCSRIGLERDDEPVFLLNDLEFIPRHSDKYDHRGDGSTNSSNLSASSFSCCCSGCDVIWCSQRCYDAKRPVHEMIDCQKMSDKLHNFDMFLDSLDEDSNDESSSSSIIFELAAQCVAVAVSTFLRDLSHWKPTTAKVESDFGDRSQGLRFLSSKYCWWKEYSSHPLWWQISVPAKSEMSNAPAQRRKILTHRRIITERFSVILTQTLLSTSPLNVDEAGNKGSSNRPRTEGLIREACSVDSLGKVLGMLQTNAMEFEYPSPFQQCVEEYNNYKQIEIIEQEGHDEGDDDAEHDSSDDNIHAKVPIAKPVVGSGLYPILTLANHDCDPNASIEFLGESNVGSMVAIRDIRKGEEITNTYVPNGDLDPSLSSSEAGQEGGGSEGENEANGQHQVVSEEVTADRFRNFRPTRTWRFLHNHLDCTGENDSSEIEGAEEEENGDGENGSEDNEDNQSVGDESTVGSHNPDIDDCEDEAQLPEGTSHVDRSFALLDYDFTCHCDRCIRERPSQSPS